MVATILEEEVGVESSPAGVNNNLEVNSSDQHWDTNVESLYDDKLNDGDDWTISEGLNLRVPADHNTVATGE